METLQLKEIDKTKNPFKIGDIVPYINSRGSVRFTKITSFDTIERNGHGWHNGVDTKTGAKTYYPVWKSVELQNSAKEK